jgi:hypothetical protein
VLLAYTIFILFTKFIHTHTYDIYSQTWPDMLKKVVNNCLRVYIDHRSPGDDGSETSIQEKNISFLKKWLSPLDDKVGTSNGIFPTAPAFTMCRNFKEWIFPSHYVFTGELGDNTLLGSWRQVLTYYTVLFIPSYVYTITNIYTYLCIPITNIVYVYTYITYLYDRILMRGKERRITPISDGANPTDCLSWTQLSGDATWRGNLGFSFYQLPSTSGSIIP